MCDCCVSESIGIDHMHTEADYAAHMSNLFRSLDAKSPARFTLRDSNSYCVGIHGVIVDIERAATTTIENHVTPGYWLRDRAVRDVLARFRLTAACD